MIYLLAPGDHDAAAVVVQAALERSCGRRQVQRISISQWLSLSAEKSGLLSVVINPPVAWSSAVERALEKRGSKMIIFGRLPKDLADLLHAINHPIDEAFIRATQCAPADANSNSSSPMTIEYNELPGLDKSPVLSRPCLRYDFTDEWNNLGYGAIRADESMWALCQLVQLPRSNLLAALKLQSKVIGAYAGLWMNNLIDNATLWFNRSVGPVDSPEWYLVERFISKTGFPDAACQPVLSEIPFGFDAAVTMRLDCDEDVESARPLWAAYQKMKVPFSLALHGNMLSEERHHKLPREVLERGGALLSHSATHAPHWGGDYMAALEEGALSAQIIEKITGRRVRYAVSPFHQTPSYARAGLADAGYSGCIGGIISNEDNFLLGRSGIPPGGVAGFIGHSQQCMLHGDCMLNEGDSLLVFKQAFDTAKASRTFFGYLDHPFSERYSYGWRTEEQRINEHVKFVSYMKNQGSVLFANESDAMDFLYDRSTIEVWQNNGRFKIHLPSDKLSKLSHSVEYGGNIYRVPVMDMEL